jgi:cbb3-type cytochrome oxidase subunit 3
MVKVFDLQKKAKEEDENEGIRYTASESIGNFTKLLFKMFFMLALLSINFLALSISLNCNKNSAMSVKFASAVFSFMFGLIYIIVNYYSYRVMTKKEVCEFDKENLFPF